MDKEEKAMVLYLFHTKLHEITPPDLKFLYKLTGLTRLTSIQSEKLVEVVERYTTVDEEIIPVHTNLKTLMEQVEELLEEYEEEEEENVPDTYDMMTRFDND